MEDHKLDPSKFIIEQRTKFVGQKQKFIFLLLNNFLNVLFTILTENAHKLKKLVRELYNLQGEDCPAFLKYFFSNNTLVM